SLHGVIKKVSDDVENMKFNTAISGLMILTNTLNMHDFINKKIYEILLRLLAPFAPHMTEELWASLGKKKSVHLEPWPKWDEKKLVADTFNLAIQVNGKIRATIEAEASASEEEITSLALAHADVKKWIGKSEPKKIIYIKNKLLSVVV
ncbi:class I tRNA ligase family protein, partial [bacterium]|nr:class I tRNA ligase family protein [bacterium]